MEFIDLKGGGRMPVLGLGTWQLKGPDCVLAVRTALDLGYRHIDTAEMYANERDIGQAIAASGIPRADLFLTTKIWTNHLHAADVRRTTDHSLRNLRTDYVDLLLVHWPNDAVPLDETLGAMAQMQAEGRTRAIGVSNFSPALLKAAMTACPVPIACDQVKFHVGHDQTPLIRAARSQGIAVTAYSPLGQGRLADHDLLREIAAAHGKKPGQIALRWLIEQDGIAAVPKAASKPNLEANIDIFDFVLSDAERQRLQQAAVSGRH